MVMDELKIILKEKGRTDEPTDDDIFKNRLSAAKRVYERLSVDDRAKIDKESVDTTTVSPPEVQRR